jgi:polyphosphate kinase
VTRNADISVREDSAADLMLGMEEVLSSRRSADFVRLEIAKDVSDITLDFLKQRIGIVDRDVFRIPGPLDLSVMMQLTDIEGFPALRDTVWPPQRSSLLDPSKSMFQTIAEQDVLLCHPYESFEPVLRLIEEAASDPDVLAIKQTLYRTSRKSPIVDALKRASERGKYVTVVVELKARFDEARNIEWARELERSGVQVVYGVRGLKTHAKICIVVRRESSGFVRYIHFGTGNYNESTARMYSDISYLTCDESLGKDASAFFNAVTGYSQPQPYEKIDSAPLGLRKKLISLIDGETQRKQMGQKAYIVAKMNSLVDPEIIEALYRASQAGVIVRLNVRGICCLRPGVPGLSENIQVISIVDRFLEHARILYFFHGGEDAVFISSADWMPRSLDRRIELLVPVEDPASQRRLVEILDTYFRDNQNAWELQSDGQYRRLEPKGSQSKIRAQKILYQNAVEAVKMAEQAARTQFEPHRPAVSKD